MGDKGKFEDENFIANEITVKLCPLIEKYCVAKAMYCIIDSYLLWLLVQTLQQHLLPIV